MGVWSDAGFQPESMDDYRQKLEDRYISAFGADLALEPETPQGQIIGISALALAEVDEAIAAAVQNLDVRTARGNALDVLGHLLGIARLPARHSEVTATLTGSAGATVPAGSRAQTSTPAIFETLEDAVIVTGGVQVEMQAVDTGPVAAAAGALNQIVTTVGGWTGVTNAAPAVPGVHEQSDTDYREALLTRTTRQGLASLAALETAVASTGATPYRVVENATATAKKVQSWPLSAHSVLVIADGGTDADLTRAVEQARGMGVAPLAAIVGGTPGTLTSFYSDTSETIQWDGTDYTGDLSASTDEATLATVLNTVLATADVRLLYSLGRFIAVYPWTAGTQPAFTSATLVDALGLDPDNATVAPGPFIRVRERTLTLTATIAVDKDMFPANGLADMRTAAINRVAAYGTGATPYTTHLQTAMENTPGTRVTAITLTDPDTTAVNGVEPPLDVRWTMAAANVTLTISGL